MSTTPAPIDVAALRRLLDDATGSGLARLSFLAALEDAAPALLRAVEERDALLAAVGTVFGRLITVHDADDGLSPWTCKQLADVLAEAMRAKEPQ